MRKLIAGAIAGSLLVALWAAPVAAAKPQHDRIRDSASDPDFCGTGQTVNMTVKGTFNGWEDKATGHIKTTWTNPANGIGIYDAISGRGTVSFVDDGGGAYTVVTTRTGQPFRLQYVKGPVIIHDAGKIVFEDHFDADDNYLGTDVIVDNGQHPGFGIDWCELMVDLLDL